MSDQENFDFAKTLEGVIDRLMPAATKNEPLQQEWASVTCDQQDSTDNSMASHFTKSHDRSREIELYNKPYEIKLMYIKEFKAKGDGLFKKKQYEEACELYARGELYETYTCPEDDEQDAEIRAISCALINNFAQAKLLLKEYDECIAKCDRVLQIDPKNEKAVFRKFSVAELLENVDQCQTIITSNAFLSEELKSNLELRLKALLSSVSSRNTSLARNMSKAFSSGT